MSIISIIAFLVAIHSVIMIAVLVLNPEWYERKAIAARVTPNLTAAITTKVILAVAGVGVGFFTL